MSKISAETCHIKQMMSRWLPLLFAYCAWQGANLFQRFKTTPKPYTSIWVINFLEPVLQFCPWSTVICFVSFVWNCHRVNVFRKAEGPLTCRTSFYFAVENLQFELILLLWVVEYKYYTLKGLAGMCSEYLNPPMCVNKYLTNRNTSEIAVLMTDEHLSAV